jgi:tetratricopeptide (TPR) repeat protein
MGVLTGLLRDVKTRLRGKRPSTLDEVRLLLDRCEVERAAEAVESLAPSTPRRELAQLCLRGEIQFRRHDDARAEQLFREALGQDAGLADAHYGLSLVMLARNELDSALRHAQFAVNLGAAPRFSAQLGLCQLTLGNHTRAKESLVQATRLDPHDKASWNNLGIVRRAIGQFAAARVAFSRALEIDPGFKSAQENLQLLEADIEAYRVALRDLNPPDGRASETVGADVAELRALAQSGRIDDAIDLCELLCGEASDRAELVIELAALYRERGDAQSGIDALFAFLARRPDDIDAISALGRMLVEGKQHKAALPWIERAHKDRPEDVDVLLALSDVRMEQGRYGDAGTLVERAYQLNPSLDMKGRLAASLCARCRYVECLALIDEMLDERPSIAEDVMGIRVDAMTALGRHAEVLPELDRFIERSPNEPNRRFLRASVNLLREDFATGWDDYAYRNLQSTRHLRMLPFPVWKGEPIEGKSIFVATEQGVGDQVMFASCIPDLERLGPARIVLEVHERVAKTIARSFPRSEVIASRQDYKLDWLRDVGPIDRFVMLGDLPARFRRSVADFPRHTGYLRPDPARRNHWSEALGSPSRPRIGLSWRGGTELTRKGLRSIDVSALAPWATTIDAQWVCLQYGDVGADLDRARDNGLDMAYWRDSIADLDEFAALVSTLDLVITVCNTTVHYAGALGVPVWVMAPRVPEWRYGIASRSMPWYPSSRMVRQEVSGDWQAVLKTINSDLAKMKGGAH